MWRRRGNHVSFLLLAAALAATACAPTHPPLRTAVGEGGTLRVALTEPAWQGLDPQSVYSFAQEEILRCCLTRTLMTYAGVPGIPGTEPLPDLTVGPPSVSSDGLTWTFRLRRGIRYAPPMQSIEVTAGDVVRALLRAGSSDVGFGQGMVYLPLVQGFSEYAAGRAGSIVGLSTPDRYTLRVQEVRPDTSIAHLFALPISAPIPPLPGDPGAPFGVATGHPIEIDFPSLPAEDGYGPFLVSTGPYMFEGASDIDFTLPPDQQHPASGFTPPWFRPDGSFPGHISLVRNPSWHPGTDLNRPAFPDRIEIDAGPEGPPLYRDLEAGKVDVILGSDPPPDVLERYRSAEDLQGRVASATGYATDFVAINVAQKPFDDLHVRRALAFTLDRAAMTRAVARAPNALSGFTATTSHVIPDPVERSFLSSWNPFASPSDKGDPAAAHAEMDASPYGKDGRCSGERCRDILVSSVPGALQRIVAAGLEEIGIGATFSDEVACSDPRAHVALCVINWAADYPDAGNMFVPFVSDRLGDLHFSLLGSTDRQLDAWGYLTRRVPSIDADYVRCAATSGVRATMCWARLDQLLVERFIAVIPIATTITVRLRGPDVTGFAIDQAFGEPALERISVVGGS